MLCSFIVPMLCAHRYTHLYVNRVILAGIHAGLSCPTPFWLMQICSLQICAGIQTTCIWLVILDTGYPLPAGMTRLKYNDECSTWERRANRSAVEDAEHPSPCPQTERKSYLLIAKSQKLTFI